MCSFAIDSDFYLAEYSNMRTWGSKGLTRVSKGLTQGSKGTTQGSKGPTQESKGPTQESKGLTHRVKGTDSGGANSGVNRDDWGSWGMTGG